MTDDVTVSFGIDSKNAKTGADQAVRSLDDIKKKAQETSKGFDGVEKSIALSGSAIKSLSNDMRTLSTAQNTLNQGLKAGVITQKEYNTTLKEIQTNLGVTAQKTEAVKSAFGGFASSLAAIGIAFKGMEILRSVNDFEQLQGKIRLLTQATGDYEEVSRSLIQTSIKTGTTLAANVNLFQQLKIASQSIGASNPQIEKFILNFEKLGAVYKLDGSHLNSTILELSHALETGTVHAQQFNRLLLDFPAIGNVISAGLGKPLAEIREEIKRGELSSKQLFDALQSGLARVAKDFDNLPASITRSTTSFSTALTVSFAKLDEGAGVIHGIATAIDLAAKNTDILSAAMVGLGAVIGGAAIIKMAEFLGLLNPIALGIAAIVTGLVLYSEKTTELQRAQEEHSKTVERAIDIEDKLKTSRGESTKNLEKDRQALIDHTIEQIKNNKARLLAYEIKLPEGTGFGAFGTKLEVDESAQKKDIIAALAEENKTLEDQYHIKKYGMTLAQEEAQVTQNLNALHEKNNTTVTAELDSEAEKRKEGIELLKENLDDEERLLAARKKSTNEYEATKIQIDAENKARSLGLEIGDEEYDQVVRDQIQLEKTKKSIDDITKARELESKATKKAGEEYNAERDKLLKAQAKPFVQASEDIQRSLTHSIADGIENGFKSGENPLKAFARILKDTIIKALAGAFAAQLTGAFINPLLQSFAGGTGSKLGNEVGKELGIQNAKSGGSIGAGSLFSLISGGKSVSSLFGSYGSSGSISGAINQFGASTFGLGTGGAPLGNAIGPTLPTGLLGSTTLSGLLGAAGVGSLIGSLGLFGGNKTGSTIGGTIGGVAGSFIPIPVVGTLIGSALGSAIGGLFGGGKSVIASEFQGNASVTGINGATFGSEGASTDTAKGLSTTLGGFLSTLQGAGINISNSAVRGSVNNKQGNKFDILGSSGLATDITKSFSFDPSNQDSIATAIAQVGVELAKGANIANKSLTIALQNIETTNRKAEDIVADLAFAAGFDTLGEAPKVIGQFQTSAKALLATFTDGEERTKRLGLSIDKYKEYEQKATKQFFDAVLNPVAALSPLQQQLKDLKATFDDLRAAAVTLGYSIDTVNAAQAVATQQLGINFNTSIAEQIKQITNPTAYAIDQLDAAFVTIRADAIAVGGDLVAVEQLYALKRKEIVRQQLDNILKIQTDSQTALVNSLTQTQTKFKQFADTLKKFREGLLLNNGLSPLSPQQRLAEARKQFESVASLAQLGNEDAIGQLQDASNTLLDASRAYNASSVAYFADFNRVQEVLSSTETLATRQANIANDQLSVAQSQLSVLQSINDKLNPASNSSILPANTNQKLGKNKAQSAALAAVTNFRGDFGGGAFDSYIRGASEGEKSRARAIIKAYSGDVPGFATGGDFGGGLRLVGEGGRGEIEATGRSRIYTATQTRDILSGASSNKAAEGINELVRLTRGRMQQSTAETVAIQEELKQLKDIVAKQNSQITRLLSRPAA